MTRTDFALLESFPFLWGWLQFRDARAHEVQTDRERLVEWLTEVPDITISLCPAVLGDLGNKKNGYPGALTAAELASEAAFVIERRDKSLEGHTRSYLEFISKSIAEIPKETLARSGD
jgi:hypothetical protein